MLNAVLIILLFSFSAQAQVPSVSENAAGSSSYGGNFLDYADVSLFNKAANSADLKEYKDIEGSAYLYEEYVLGTLITTDGHTIAEVPLKWNIYTQEIVVKSHSGDDILLDEYQYQTIFYPYEGREIELRRCNNQRPNVFYEIIFEEEKLLLFKEHYATIQEGHNQGLSKSAKKFSPRSRYYVIQGNGDAERTKLKRKSLFSMFPPATAQALESFAKQNNLKLNNEADFVALFKAVYEQE